MQSGLHLYTIGHSNHPVEAFIQLLQQYEISLLADVRTAPYSRYNKQFNREALQTSLEQANIAYRWMGETLGGKREDLQSSMGFRQEELFNKDAAYQRGIEELIGLTGQQRTAIMCSEEDPRHCHRHRIISTTLLYGKTAAAKQLSSIHIHHIRANGNIEDAAKIPVVYQPPLF
ncbi:MAG: DUF488 domain-containing protein [Niastella sp.]|nr:DUF488 domain-containing protein [Niastella sp.]